MEVPPRVRALRAAPEPDPAAAVAPALAAAPASSSTVPSTASASSSTSSASRRRAQALPRVAVPSGELRQARRPPLTHGFDAPRKALPALRLGALDGRVPLADLRRLGHREGLAGLGLLCPPLSRRAHAHFHLCRKRVDEQTINTPRESVRLFVPQRMDTASAT